MKLATCSVLCCIMSAVLVHGAPRVTERRVSRDLEMLFRLQKQIESLAASEKNRKTARSDRETGSRIDAVSDDISAENDVSKLQSGTKAQMTSERQQQVQQLAQKLGHGTKSDLQTLAITLDQLLKQRPEEEEEEEEMEEPRRSNSAGEYLSDKYNGFRGQSAAYREDSNEDDSDDSDDGDDKEEERSRMQILYNMLERLYRQQQTEERAAGQSTPLQHRRRNPNTGAQTHRSLPAVQVDEGSFGDFVDEGEEEDEDSMPSALSSSPPRARPYGMRDAVLSAIENKLLRDVQDARDAGISVDEIIQDLQNKGNQLKHEKLREIERELDELSRSR